MCCTNLSNFVADLHSLNGNCSKDTIKLGGLNHSVTSIIYVTTAFLCIFLGLVTHFKYNSVTVLNLTVRSHVISNTAWIVYLAVLFLRSAVGAVIYGITPIRKDHPVRQMVYFIADGALKSLEVLCLSWALHHQWKYRSSGFFQQEINSFNTGEYSVTGSDQGIRPNLWPFKSKSGALFVIQFLFTMLFLILLEVLFYRNESPECLKALYWTYLGMFWIQCITTIVWVISIAKITHEEGPTLMTKILLVVGVLIILPGDIPSFVWSFCICCICIPWSFLTCYDIALFLSIPSVIIFFLVLRREFLRLDQEAQYSVVRGEVDSLYSVHSQSTDQS